MKPPVRGWLAKLMRYGFTGGLAAFVDLAGFAILLGAGVVLPAAAFLSFMFATVVNYGFSARFAFASPISISGYFRFLIFAAIGLVTNVAITILFDAAGLPSVRAKLAGIAVAFGVNFVLNLTYVFAQPDRRKKHLP
ncbi:GtrA family protein [Paracoccus nototheniae]|uniref:GtrA family protein n=1 Tax=Paracoccus nototheniae TaxID=2489002 RepID=A0ABW4E2W0_9RHOB|nr:GtrA family protein [Paracoccus nototheniae]